MSLLSVLDTKKKPKSVDKSAELLKQAEAQTKYPLGDGKIKNPADYFREPPSDAYDPRANPTSISLSTRCHPQEVFEQSVVKLYGEKPLSYLLQTMLNCRKNARLARKNGDYERSCILFSRAIGLAIDLPSYQDYYERFGHKGEEGRKKLKLEAVEEAATLAPCINARFFLRRDGGREVEAKHAKPERPPRDVWLELGRSWRAVKSSITTKSETATTPPDLVVQNLQLEAEYVTPPAVVPQPSPFPWGQTQVPTSNSGTGRSESRGSTHGRRSSIVKVDKDLPPPPKQAEAEGYSFNVEYTDSPSSTVPTRAWESEDPDDDDESLPTYGAVLLEAYADDPTPPALVLAFRRGQVTDEDMGYLSGANSSVTSLLGDVSTGGTVFHSAASTAPPSDSEDTVSSRKGIREKVPDVKRSDEKVSEKGSKKKANSLEQANAEIAQSRHQFERELDAALRHLETITTARQSLPPDEAEHEVFDEKTKFAVKKMNEMVNPQKKAGY